MPTKKNRQFKLILVGKELQNGSKFEPVEVFYTHYRAQKFLLERLSQKPQPQHFRWVIRTEQPNY